MYLCWDKCAGSGSFSSAVQTSVVVTVEHNNNAHADSVVNYVHAYVRLWVTNEIRNCVTGDS